MKKPFKIIALLFVGLIVLSVLSLHSGSGTSSASPLGARTTSGSARPAPTPRPAIVAAQTLVQQYDANKLAAQQRYTGKVVQTTARVTNISSSFGQAYIVLEPTQETTFTLTSITCDFDSETPLLKLQKGQQVTVRGTMQDMSLTLVTMEHCALVGR